MIITKNVEIVLSGSNTKHFKSLGYKLPYRKDKRGRMTFPKYSKITVKVNDLLRESNTKVLVKCEDCGKERYVQYNTLVGRKNSQYLITGETLCSNCANHRMSGKNSGAYKHGNILYPQYRSNARRRGIEFELTVKQFEELIPGKCFYCGDDSKGIDRIDSNKGYYVDNCVPCCAQCNFIKNTMPLDMFVKKIKTMYYTFIKNGL